MISKVELSVYQRVDLDQRRFPGELDGFRSEGECGLNERPAGTRTQLKEGEGDRVVHCQRRVVVKDGKVGRCVEGDRVSV